MEISGVIVQILKQDIINLVSSLSEKFDMEEFMYKLYVLDKVKKGQKDIKEDNFISSDELRREIEKW